MITLSKRMDAIAQLITPGYRVADVGTDHAYIPIYQVLSGKSPSAIAMDLRKGPLERAREHIIQFGLKEQIQTRLSDGVEALLPEEADAIVVAGMGGELIVRILSKGENVCKAVRELILQPQSELAGVRRFLRKNGYVIVEEDMVFEDGKYYPMMRVTPNGLRNEQADGEALLLDLYGPVLLEQGHPVLVQFLQYQKAQLEELLHALSLQPSSDKITGRIQEIEEKLEYNSMAQNRIQGTKAV